MGLGTGLPIFLEYSQRLTRKLELYMYNTSSLSLWLQPLVQLSRPTGMSFLFSCLALPTICMKDMSTSSLVLLHPLELSASSSLGVFRPHATHTQRNYESILFFSLSCSLLVPPSISHSIHALAFVPPM